MSDWRDTKRELNRGMRWGIGWYILIVIIILALAAGIWGLTVALSGPKGQGDAIIEKNSAENWTAAQAKFEEMYAEIVASDKRVQIAYDALQADTADKTLQTNYTGAQQYCIDVVADYNAEARKFLSEDFRSADLPPQISDFDLTTDCKAVIPS